MKYIPVILIFLTVSCLVVPLPAHRTSGRISIKPEMVNFIKKDTTQLKEIFLNLGDPDGVAIKQQILIYHWTVSKGIIAAGGTYSGAVTDINQQRFFLIALNKNNTVRKFEIFNHNIDRFNKPLSQFLEEWLANTAY